MSASPPSSDGAEMAEAAKSDQIHFRFCRECSNLLYPREDKTSNTLMFVCRTCHVGEPSTSHCVYQNKLNNVVGDTAGVTQDVGSDPTVSLPETLYDIGICTLCGDIICEMCKEHIARMNYDDGDLHELPTEDKSIGVIDKDTVTDN